MNILRRSQIQVLHNQASVRRLQSLNTTHVACNPRKLALVQIDKGVYSSFVDDHVIDWDSDEIARRLSTLLVSGVERMKLKLDYILDGYLTKPLKRLHPEVLQSLRMGVYELVELRKPNYVVNEYVNLVKKFKMSKLVNAVLRQIARDLESNSSLVPEIDLTKDSSELASYLSIVYSHPEWMIHRWLKRFGLEDTIQLMRHNNKTPTQGLRVNQGVDAQELLSLLKEEGVVAEVSPYLPEHFLRVKSGLQSTLHSSKITQGKYSIQDEAAGLVVSMMLNPRPGEKILDCCSAPGGKLTFAAQLMEGKGHITALDPNRMRLEKTSKLATLLSLDHMITFLCTSLQDFAKHRIQEGQLFEKVLLDVPCSGTGVMGKKSDLRWKRKLEDIIGLMSLQDDLLESASQLVQPGGLLVYSTCSLEPEENEDRVLNFITSHPDFNFQLKSYSNMSSKEGFLQTLPYIHHIDGAFAACLYRKL